MSGDVQPRKRKDKKRRKDDEPVPVQTHTPIYTSNLVNDDVNIHVHKESGTGGGICAKLVFFVLLSALAVLIGLIITEHRGLTDLETADSESKFSQIFEGWIDSSSNSHDDHDLEDALDADHDDDHDDDHEEVDLSEGEEDHQASEEDEEHEHSDENEEHQPSEEDDEQERSEEENEEGENESAEEYIEENGDEDEETDMDEEKYSEEENEVVQDNNSDEEVADERDNEDEGEYAEDQDEVKASDEEQEDGENDDEEEEQKQDEKDDDEVDDEEEVDEEETFESKEEEDASTKKATSSLEKDTLRKGEEKLSDKKFSKRSSEVESNPADDPDETSNGTERKQVEDSDSDRQSDDADYEHMNITNKEDFNIRHDIDEAQNSVESNPNYAIRLFDTILQKFPSSPRSLYGKALALDRLADQKKSNSILEQALRLYLELIRSRNVPDPLFELAAERCLNRMRFIGQYSNAIMVHKLVIDRFPNTPKYMNDMAITYLTINRIDDARSVLKQVLAKWPDDGVALVHYGFILKTADNKLNSAVKYLKRGILTREKGVLDGRFFFHLGDALTRLGKTEEAMKVYEEGTKHKLFLSKYQRSLYNVPRLTGKPWWQSKDLPYLPSFELLKKNWRKIREEALSVLNVKGYFQDESENLKDTGDWKQFELYARGKKNSRNCGRCPFTCSILDQIPEAAGCKRGQTKFSVMHPGTHIWPHCGPTNCRLRTHLGLKVPSGTYIRVASETRSWKEGEILVFDDSYEHEVWHNGTEFRLVLIVDVWHPELTPSEKKNLSPI